MRRGQLRDEHLLMTQRHIHAQSQARAADEQSQRARSNQAWDQVHELNEECDELNEEVQSLKEQLSKSKALNRLTMIQNRGLVETIRHLRKSWTPDNPAEMPYKEKISPLIQNKVEQVEGDTKIVEQVEAEILEKTKPTPRTRGPKR